MQVKRMDASERYSVGRLSAWGIRAFWVATAEECSEHVTEREHLICLGSFNFVNF